MKTKLLSILTALLLTSATVTAQENSKKDFKRHEVSLGYGIGPISDIGNLEAALFLVPTLALTEKTGSVTGAGAINLDYSYHFTKMVAISGNVSYTQEKFSTYDKETHVLINNYEINIFTVMAGAKFDWLNLKHFALYSRLGAGVMLSNGTAGFMFHVSPVGLEGGASFLRAYLELGFGQNGIISFGIRGRF